MKDCTYRWLSITRASGRQKNIFFCNCLSDISNKWNNDVTIHFDLLLYFVACGNKMFYWHKQKVAQLCIHYKRHTIDLVENVFLGHLLSAPVIMEISFVPDKPSHFTQLLHFTQLVDIEHDLISVLVITKHFLTSWREILTQNFKKRCKNLEWWQ